MKGLIVVLFIFAGVGVLLGALSAVLFFCGNDVYGSVGMVSTIISILLGIISMVYSYVSGLKTSSLFESFVQKIDKLDEQIGKVELHAAKLDEQIDSLEKQNYALVQKIRKELSEDNFGQANIDNIRRRKR